jgi:hypothetical protein
MSCADCLALCLGRMAGAEAESVLRLQARPRVDFKRSAWQWAARPSSRRALSLVLPMLLVSLLMTR